MSTRGRYAPSPSGPLHIGNLRTAFLAWLAARSRGAPFVLRIEDLDRERSRLEYERCQLADLAALGLDWDGPVMRQSERLEGHREAFERLCAAGCVYPCWCTRADIHEAASAPHLASGRGRYPGTCRHLSAAERRRRARESGRAPVWRLDGRSERVCFQDLLCGPCEGVVDDVILWRADDAPAYNLAVVVDDDAQSVGEVVRGDDLIDSTPTQIFLADILGLARPAYLHVPLVLGPGRRRLASGTGHSPSDSGWPPARPSLRSSIGWRAAQVLLTARSRPPSMYCSPHSSHSSSAASLSSCRQQARSSESGRREHREGCSCNGEPQTDQESRSAGHKPELG